MSSCDAWIQFVTPSDVKALKMRLSPYFLALDTGIAQCPRITQETRDAWDAFAKGWRAYYGTEEHFLTAGAEHRTGCEYEAAIASWQRTIGSYACGVAGPALPDRAGGGDGPSSGDDSTKKTIRTVAIGAAVVAAALAIRGFTR